MLEALATRAIGFFMYETDQTAYHNVVNIENQDHMRSPSSSPFVVQKLLSSLVKEDLIREEHQEVETANMKPSETEIVFAGHLQ